MTATAILGIDGGGSKTLIALADRSGSVLRLKRGEGVNPLDNDSWRRNLAALLADFAGEAGIGFVAAALPAYGEVAEVSAAQRAAVAAAFDATIGQQVLNDVDAAHLGAFAGGPGILVLSGTGSMAWARDAGGMSFRVGGWGDVIGDEGSGHWIGMRVLGLITQSLDGRAPPTRLVEAVFEALAIDSKDAMNGLEGWLARLDHRRSAIAGLAPIAARLAEAGDAGAIAIIEEAVEHLARHVTAIARLSGLPPDWSFAGGSFASRLLRERVASKIGRPPQLPILPPIGGALLCAAQQLGWPVDQAWIGRLAASIQLRTAPMGSSEPDKQPQPTD
jgi:glucosamine kinase